MNIVIAGLGIIGGSFAKAIKKYTNHRVIGINRSKAPLEKALACGAIDEIGDVQSLGSADLLILGIYPAAAVEFIEKNGRYIKKGCIVTDTSGIKSAICPQMTALAKKYGFTFVGSHPMAGKEKNGFDVSTADLFKGASFIVVPCGAPQSAVDLLTSLALSIGFGGVRMTDPQEHDRMIAFTSQLPHVLACAYVLSPQCKNHNGFSAGSYRDVSRVANINAPLWAELFLENRQPLTSELDLLIQNIKAIREAINQEDKQTLTGLLEQGRKVKEALGE